VIDAWRRRGQQHLSVLDGNSIRGEVVNNEVLD